ncbi:MAG: D-glycero-beta-D-manno-heptose 1-phosphate adenylyltransferase [Fimbriimonadaceae bacterium]
MTIDEARRLRAGKRLVFTNGVFDIIHAGHVRYLTQARALGDMLIVGLNTDGSARLLGKGPDRPINPLEDRAEVLAALRAVDAVVAFEDRTPVALVAELQPEVYVKGGDYRLEDLPEAPIVQAYGGEVVLLPFLKGRSTTSILRRLNLPEDGR